MNSALSLKTRKSCANPLGNEELFLVLGREDNPHYQQAKPVRVVSGEAKSTT